MLHFSGSFAAGVGITSESHNSTNHRRGKQPIKLSLSRRTISQLWFKVLRAQTCWNDEVAAILQSILDLGRRWSIVQTDVGRTQSIQTWSRSLWEMMSLEVGLGNPWQETAQRACSLYKLWSSSPLFHSRNLPIFCLRHNYPFIVVKDVILNGKPLQNDLIFLYLCWKIILKLDEINKNQVRSVFSFWPWGTITEC